MTGSNGSQTRQTKLDTGSSIPCRTRPLLKCREPRGEFDLPNFRCDRARIFVSNATLAVDDEGFRGTGDPEGDGRAAGVIKADAGEWISKSVEPGCPGAPVCPSSSRREW